MIGMTNVLKVSNETFTLTSYQKVYSTRRCHLGQRAAALREDDEGNCVNHDVSRNIKGEPVTIFELFVNFICEFETGAPDDVELVSFGFDRSQLRNHGQVRNLSGCPAELKHADENNKNKQVTDAICAFAQSHATDEHQRERQYDANRSCVRNYRLYRISNQLKINSPIKCQIFLLP